MIDRNGRLPGCEVLGWSPFGRVEHGGEWVVTMAGWFVPKESRAVLTGEGAKWWCTKEETNRLRKTTTNASDKVGAWYSESLDPELIYLVNEPQKRLFWGQGPVTFFSPWASRN